MRRNFWIDAFHDSLVESFHVLGCKWRIESYELVQYRSKRPYIRLVIVRFILPDFRTGIIRSPCLCFQNPGFRNFRYIQITEFNHSIFGQKHISTLDISMNNILVMQSFQTQNHLVKYGPNIRLLGKARSLFSIINFGLQVSIVTVLHDDTQ